MAFSYFPSACHASPRFLWSFAPLGCASPTAFQIEPIQTNYSTGNADRKATVQELLIGVEAI